MYLIVPKFSSDSGSMSSNISLISRPYILGAEAKAYRFISMPLHPFTYGEGRGLIGP
jgi:hypothetical protein